jgi:hypothetical protein
VWAFPKLRALTWETPEIRPAPYLQNRCRGAARNRDRFISPAPSRGGLRLFLEEFQGGTSLPADSQRVARTALPLFPRSAKVANTGVREWTCSHM